MGRALKTALLLCDHVLPQFESINGAYPEMFGKLLPELDLEVVAVCDGHFPAAVQDYEAYIMTGSKYSVYDEIDWIIKLKALVGEIHAAGIPFVGVCFGHQMMAEALGGKVAKAERGWCIGVHSFSCSEQMEWMQPFSNDFNLLMLCQDQVQRLPPNSTVLAHSPKAPVGMFQIGTQMLGIQAHPEFSKAYNQALYESRTERIGEETIRAAQQTMHLPIHARLISDWIMQFLEAAALIYSKSQDQ